MSGSSAVVLGFLVYLYLPHVFFKLGAEKWVDLGRKKDSSQIEEFLSAALPSACLNLFASLFIFVPRIAIHYLIAWPANFIATLLSERFWVIYSRFLSWTPGSVDWHAIAQLLSSGDEASVGVFQYVSRGAWWGELAYAAWLYIVAIFNGAMYGRIVQARIRRGATREKLQLGEITTGMSPVRRLRWFIGSIFYRIWDPFYHEFHVSMFMWMTRRSYVWIRTADSRLFFGSFYRYEKTSAGEISGITLSDVYRYKYDEQPADLDRFIGSVFFPWERIAELNVTTLDSFNAVRRRLAKREVLQKVPLKEPDP